MKSLLFLFALISLQRCPQLTIEGEWANKDDEQTVVKFEKKLFHEIYGGKNLKTQKYVLTHESCDSSYFRDKNKKKLEFISLQDGSCYEIMGLTDSTLTYRHTTSGRLHKFYRISTKK